MQFTKMQGAGNDYVYVNCFEEPIPHDPGAVARRIADRHFGVGGDGLILICPSNVADVRMRMFNADGSEAEMCGNGIRCVAKYAYDHGLAVKTALTVETGLGVLSLALEVRDGAVSRVRVNMGRPTLIPAEVPTTLRAPGNDTAPAVNVPLEVAGELLLATCVSMGNPHCVVFVDQLNDRWVHDVGRRVECDPHFPRRVNAEFVEVVSRNELRMRVWERGSGETLACGTGAAAVCVAGVLTGRSERRVLIHLLGGDLELDWAADDCVYQTGPAVEVFSGHWCDPTQSVEPAGSHSRQ